MNPTQQRPPLTRPARAAAAPPDGLPPVARTGRPVKARHRRPGLLHRRLPEFFAAALIVTYLTGVTWAVCDGPWTRSKTVVVLICGGAALHMLVALYRWDHHRAGRPR